MEIQSGPVPDFSIPFLFVKTVGGNQTASFIQSFPKRRFEGDGLGTGVNHFGVFCLGAEPLELFRVLIS